MKQPTETTTMRLNNDLHRLAFIAFILACVSIMMLCGCGKSHSFTAAPQVPVVAQPLPIDPLEASKGLLCNVYSIRSSDEAGTVNWGTLLANGQYKFSTVVPNFDIVDQSANNVFGNFTPEQQALVGATDYALDCHGYLDVAETGYYLIELGSDDGSGVAIDNLAVINMPQLQSYRSSQATVALLFGKHPINVVYFQGPQTNVGLTLKWQGPANTAYMTLAPIPAAVLSH